MPKIIVTVDRTGNAKVEAEGYVGNACDIATRSYELVLTGGGSKTDRQDKPEFFATHTEFDQNENG